MVHDEFIKNESFFDFNPVVFGYEDCEGNHSYGPAIRTYWLIHFVVSGSGVFKTENGEYNVGAGEMFAISPYKNTYYKADAKNPWSYIWIGFTSSSKLTEYLSDTMYIPKAAEIFDSMKNCSRYSAGKSAYLSARLWDLFAVIANENSDSAAYSDYVQKALECIHSEYMNDITVESLAKRLNLERTYFSAIFKRKTGMSPKKYIINCRMNAAKSLISKNDIPISVVAASVGYTDLFMFSKMFKKQFGMSPTNYRKLLKKKA